MDEVDAFDDNTYTGVVNRFSGSGNAIVKHGADEVNLGKIDKSAENKEVIYEYTGGTYGRCISDKYISEEYKNSQDARENVTTNFIEKQDRSGGSSQKSIKSGKYDPSDQAGTKNDLLNDTK
jgi:hypothetical protein